MLALKTAMAGSHPVALIFDEIDAGVGGKTAEAAGHEDGGTEARSNQVPLCDAPAADRLYGGTPLPGAKAGGAATGRMVDDRSARGRSPRWRTRANARWGRKQRLRSTLASFWPRPPADARPERAPEGRLRGRVRSTRRTKSLCLRLSAGEIAVIDHADLDGAAACTASPSAKPAAVVNAAPSVTGRYPNTRPAVFCWTPASRCLDACGRDLWSGLPRGKLRELGAREVWLDGALMARGTGSRREALEEQLDAARRNLGRGAPGVLPEHAGVPGPRDGAGRRGHSYAAA